MGNSDVVKQRRDSFKFLKRLFFDVQPTHTFKNTVKSHTQDDIPTECKTREHKI